MCHSPGVAKAIAKDPSKSNNELDLWSDMDDAKAQALIRRMVDKKVALTPNFLNTVPGLPKDWGRMQAENQKLFSDPSILTFFPEVTTIGRVRGLDGAGGPPQPCASDAGTPLCVSGDGRDISISCASTACTLKLEEGC